MSHQATVIPSPRRTTRTDRPMLVRDYTPADRAGCLAVFAGNAPPPARAGARRVFAGTPPPYFLPHEADEFAAFLDRPPGPYLVVVEDEVLVGCGGFRVAGEAAALTWGMVRRERHRERIGWHLL